jgi:YD repeat-containing protein
LDGGAKGFGSVSQQNNNAERSENCLRILKDLDSYQKSYQYDGASHRPVKITNALGDSIEIADQADGQIKRYQNLDGAVYEYLYDDLGQLVEERHPMGYSKTIQPLAPT